MTRAIVNIYDVIEKFRMESKQLHDDTITF